MRICCTSDLHGHLPEIPDCDLLLLGGDYPPMPQPREQYWWYRDQFAPWLESIHKRGTETVGVAGNWDSLFEKDYKRLPRMDWTYLQDSGVTRFGLQIFGLPWQLRYGDWAFNLDEDELEERYSHIPKGTDIIISHGPPKGLGDKTIHRERCGSVSLKERIHQIVPRLVVCGHNHSGYGLHASVFTNSCGVVERKIYVVNASHVNEAREPANPPIIVEL